MAQKQVRISPENEVYFRGKAEEVGGSFQFQVNKALDKVREQEKSESPSK